MWSVVISVSLEIFQDQLTVTNQIGRQVTDEGGTLPVDEDEGQRPMPCTNTPVFIFFSWRSWEMQPQWSLSWHRRSSFLPPSRSPPPPSPYGAAATPSFGTPPSSYPGAGVSEPRQDCGSLYAQQTHTVVGTLGTTPNAQIEQAVILNGHGRI